MDASGDESDAVATLWQQETFTGNVKRKVVHPSYLAWLDNVLEIRETANYDIKDL